MSERSRVWLGPEAELKLQTGEVLGRVKEPLGWVRWETRTGLLASVCAMRWCLHLRDIIKGSTGRGTGCAGPCPSTPAGVADNRSFKHWREKKHCTLFLGLL